MCFEIFIIKLLLNIQARHWSSHSNPLSVAKESITPSRGALRSLAHDNRVLKSVKEGKEEEAITKLRETGYGALFAKEKKEQEIHCGC